MDKVKNRKFFKNILYFLLAVVLGTQFGFGQRVINGTVSENGIGLPGFSVILMGTTTGAVTDFDGLYTIKVESDSDVLQFSSIGYITQELPVNNLTTLDVAMQMVYRQRR